MNSIWKAYFGMFDNKTKKQYHFGDLITEDDDTDDWDDDTDSDEADDSEEDETDDEDDDTDSDDSEEDKDETDDEDKKSAEESEKEKQNGANLKFSADLAAEFGNTCNKFTNIAANVVKQRTVDKETSQTLYKMLDKLKSLIDAANNSI